MTPTPDNILDLIIEKDGNCLQPAFCWVCPFQQKCHVRFVNSKAPTRKERVDMALDAIARKEIMADEK